MLPVPEEVISGNMEREYGMWESISASPPRLNSLSNGFARTGNYSRAITALFSDDGAGITQVGISARGVVSEGTYRVSWRAITHLYMYKHGYKVEPSQARHHIYFLSLFLSFSLS